MDAEALRALAEIKKRKECVWSNICREANVSESASRTFVMPRRGFTWRMGIAAVMTAVIALGTFVYISRLDNKIDELSECSHSIVASTDMAIGNLEDGTTIKLAAGTEVGYDFTEKERVVVLKGFASFDVARDESRPFYVRLQGRDAEVAVLGTSFIVDNIDGRDKCGVRVKSGNVRLSTPAQTVDLKYGQRAIVSGSAIEKSGMSTTAVGDWGTGTLELRNANLKDVIDELMMLYPEIKKVSDTDNLVEAQKDILVTSKFEKEPIDKVLKELSLHYGIKMEFDGESLTLTR